MIEAWPSLELVEWLAKWFERPTTTRLPEELEAELLDLAGASQGDLRPPERAARALLRHTWPPPPAGMGEREIAAMEAAMQALSSVAWRAA